MTDERPYRCVCGTLMCVKIFMRQEPCRTIEDAEGCEYAQEYKRAYNAKGKKVEFARTLYEYKGKGNFTSGFAPLTRQEVAGFFARLPKKLDCKEIGERSMRILLEKLETLSKQS